MIPIGAARNGDPLVLSFPFEDRCEVGLVSHEHLWSDDDFDARVAYVCVTKTVEEYLLRSVEGKYLPIDYYAAQELSELRREMGDGTDPAS
jgi:hypothetical protein